MHGYLYTYRADKLFFFGTHNSSFFFFIQQRRGMLQKTKTQLCALFNPLREAVKAIALLPLLSLSPETTYSMLLLFVNISIHKATCAKAAQVWT
jgi:hypothetical protein